jgi:hypothetical protein
MENIINFISNIDNSTYNKIRHSKSDAECRRYLKEQLTKQLTLTDVVVPKGTLCGYVNCEKPTVDIDQKWCEYHDRQINM